MSVILKAVAGILVTIILSQILNKQGKDMSILLVVAVCCMVFSAAITYLEPVKQFIERLQSIGHLNTPMMRILLKSVGIGLLCEITCLICSDMGNAALGKSLQILSAAVILWLSVPLFEQLLDLLESVLGAV